MNVIIQSKKRHPAAEFVIVGIATVVCAGLTFAFAFLH